MSATPLTIPRPAMAAASASESPSSSPSPASSSPALAHRAPLSALLAARATTTSPSSSTSSSPSSSPPAHEPYNPYRHPRAMGLVQDHASGFIWNDEALAPLRGGYMSSRDARAAQLAFLARTEPKVYVVDV
ncbi:hypothetical protein AMAG_16205 [Allomyces macrogynus ATCC 38327]|uniref:Uncharacterized protein n=1 Tax=Allomyces macrogynus (strain ATCC 38327) TaxID=578462 RepID=A0A0L0TA77_ALLM3|nr:hypothetical protein AMAG_16205 [Allomyces macrogynus ATCC 38327]|eukprot:KNE71647.1 hypothetical protein AMAG_16205 [Allomyces macrogynus ATCC 38327]